MNGILDRIDVRSWKLDLRFQSRLQRFQFKDVHAPMKMLWPGTSPPLYSYLILHSYGANTLSQRSQLFPEDRLNGSRSSTPSRASQGYNTSSNRFNSQVMDSLEGQNDEMIEGLSQKVRILKNVFTVFCWRWLMKLGDCEDWWRNSRFVKFDGYDGITSFLRIKSSLLYRMKTLRIQESIYPGRWDGCSGWQNDRV